MTFGKRNRAGHFLGKKIEGERVCEGWLGNVGACDSLILGSVFSLKQRSKSKYTLYIRKYIDWIWSGGKLKSIINGQMTRKKAEMTRFQRNILCQF